MSARELTRIMWYLEATEVWVGFRYDRQQGRLLVGVLGLGLAVHFGKR